MIIDRKLLREEIINFRNALEREDVRAHLSKRGVTGTKTLENGYGICVGNDKGLKSIGYTREGTGIILRYSSNNGGGYAKIEITCSEDIKGFERVRRINDNLLQERRAKKDLKEELTILEEILS